MHRTKHRAALTAAVVAVAATAALTGPAASAAPRAAHTEPVSVTPEGKAGDHPSGPAVISRNGRYLAFTSEATDLLPGTSNGGMFVRDLRTGKTRWAGYGEGVSVSGDVVSISDDGRRLVFVSADDVWLRDLRTGRNTAFGIQVPEGFTGQPREVSATPNGRYAVFTLQEIDEGNVVFLHDRVTGTTERISHPRPTWEPRNAYQPTVSDDGSRVVYQYNYRNGPRGDDWGDIWLYDRATATRTQIDRSYDGSKTERESLEPSLSGDGRTVVFESRDTHLIPDDNDGSWNVFVHDVATGVNQRLHAAHGGPRAAHTRNPAVSADGRYVTFRSEVEEPGSRYGTEWPVYVRDMKKGTTTLVTPDSTGGTATADVLPGGIADGARRIVFRSSDPELIPAGDTNDGTDVFVRHLR
ncbi:TolB-like translocation protein [Streptomyces acidicola]|uniref:WD40 repeat protein n=1 Tax=Streptomyces acidicola TaxID=2596892 RepID=A0A5N8WPC3_9ACTN|nr:PD40 domain-containing protein [Streptomyces acidicola]MPY49280.1 hypothetical protein [Streptomyces acidicola]